jgi:predicted dehydrogenase
MERHGTRRVKVGVVGCGVVASAYYLPYLRRVETAELIAVCDRDGARAASCARLFEAREAYDDYGEMLRRADIEAVFILTGPGTHVDFTLRAVAQGKHVLLQKPMATSLDEAHAIVDAVRAAGVKVLVEPSSNSPLDPAYPPLRALLDAGALGTPYWFTCLEAVPDHYHPSMGGNPFGEGTFYRKDTGGMLFDYPYAPTQIVTLLGPCKSVMGMAKLSAPDRYIVPEEAYTAFLAGATDPENANYWDVVVNMPRTHHVRMEAEDNVASLYEMASGAMGVFHVGRPFHPMLQGAGGGGLRVFGTEGNLVMGQGYFASVISTRKDLLPSVEADGWHHIPQRGDQARAQWPKPTPGGFNYYHASTEHFLTCILEDREPLLTVEWGRHITEMMAGAIESSRTGRRYDMTTTPIGRL